VLKQLNKAQIIFINHYMDVFNRPGQDFIRQKNSQKLILAVRKNSFIYPGAKVCDHYGYDRFFYATQMMNCPYDCQYCYLLGTYNSANIAAFVNTEDYFEALSQTEPAYISLSYETDLLAMEPLFGFVGEWLGFAEKAKAHTFEIRTKSTTVLKGKPLPNVIFAWSITNAHEKGVPSVTSRIQAMKETADNGWKVRLCIDPVWITPDWETAIDEILKQTADIDIYAISAGGFRCSKAQYKKIRKAKPHLVFPTLIEQEGVVRYPLETEEKIYEKINHFIAGRNFNELC
jgi:spore photoproduct lyase